MGKRGIYFDNTAATLYFVLLSIHGVHVFGSPDLLSAVGSFNGSLDAFNARRVLEATSASFEQIFTDFLNYSNSTQEYTSRCLVDFAALFTMPGRNVFKASKGLEAVDALGKPGSYILYGNIQMWGGFDECLNIGDDLIQYWLVPIYIYVQSSPTVPPVPILPVPIRLGMCVPRSCNSTDLEYFVNISNTFLHNGVNFSIVADYDNVLITKSKTTPLNSGAIAMVVVCAAFLVLALVGSIVDMGEQNMDNLLSKFSFPVRDPEQCSESTPVLHGHNNTSQVVHSHTFSSLKKPLEFITAFSLFKNVRMILSTKQPPTVINSLNGIRVISMFWIILNHTNENLHTSSGFTNPLYVFRVVEPRFSNQVINSKAFAVDSFFFLSGTLVAYHTLKEMEKRRGRFPFITYYLHRYLRLTMVYAFVLFFWWTLTDYLGNGPIWTDEIPRICDKYWWTNLLYINNFYPWNMGMECMNWTWYLAADMQFYILAPLLIIPFYNVYHIGLLLSALLIAASLTTIGAIAGIHEYPARLFAENFGESLNDIYVKPYCRAAPYIVGLILGFILYRKIRINIHWFVDWLIYCAMWLVAAGCCFSVVYGLYSSWNGHKLTRAENVSFLMFGRFVWSVGVALVVFACHNGYGWIVNDFLSMKIWIPLSRLTYSAYLVHLIVLYTITGSFRDQFTYAATTMGVYVVAFAVLSYGAAGVVAVFVEFPLSNLESLVFKALGLTRRKSVKPEEEESAAKNKVNTKPGSHTIYFSNKHNVTQNNVTSSFEKDEK